MCIIPEKDIWQSISNFLTRVGSIIITKPAVNYRVEDPVMVLTELLVGLVALCLNDPAMSLKHSLTTNLYRVLVVAKKRLFNIKIVHFYLTYYKFIMVTPVLNYTVNNFYQNEKEISIPWLEIEVIEVDKIKY